ncbi:MAG: hypothetical protein IID15_00005 [Candidatus Marinimicrobia bacterium]|nr:hypothetical protein [Candidatus Neomarinimicrobiota bacterium]
MNMLVPFLGAAATVILWLALAESPALLGFPPINLSDGWRWGGTIIFILDAVITLFWSLVMLSHADREGTYTVNGPYAYLRHPIYGALLYSGTAGVAFAFSAWPVLLAVMPLSIMWTLIANWEELALLETYGDDYRSYMQETGQLFPRLTHLWRRSGNDFDNSSEL